MADDTPPGLEDFLATPSTAAADTPDGLDQFLAPEIKQAQFETPGQMALTGLEGAAKGFAGPLATGTERVLSAAGVPGLSPEEQEARAEANPGIHAATEVAGLGAGMLTGTGEAALMAKAGEGAVKLAGIAGKTGFLAKMGAGALRGAVENSIFQAGDEVSKLINHGDPMQVAQSAIPDLGLSALIGAAVGAPLGAASALWKGVHGAPVGQAIQDFNGAMEGSIVDHAAEAPVRELEQAGLRGRLSSLKPNASQIIDAADRNQWPVLEGIVSGSHEIQQAEDALLNGPVTVPAAARRKAYGEAVSAVRSTVDRATAAGEGVSETEAGNALKESLTGKLSNEYAPIKRLYDEIEPYQQEIPVSDRSTGAISRGLNQELEKLVPGTSRFNFMKSMIDRLGWVDDLSKLKDFRTEVWKSAGIESKDLAHTITSSLDGMEERAIQRFAEKQSDPTILRGLIDQMDSAKGAYRAFREKLQGLGNVLGKKKIYGPQDFIDFVDEMNPQSLSRKLFNENNTEFATKFAKEFPDEMGIMRDYQRGQIREAAMKDGVFQPKAAIKSILKLEPEMQKLLFSDAELQTLNDAKVYLDAFPKAFNPSGTAHTTAFREFFEHPTGAAIANLRDFGIQAFIKAFGRAGGSAAEKEAGRLLPLLGNAVHGKEVNPTAFKNAVDYTVSVIRGDAMLSKAAKNLFHASVPISGEIISKDTDTEKLDKTLQDYATNPEKLEGVGAEVGHYLPNHDIGVKATAANAVQYLNGIRPAKIKPSPLDPELEPSEVAKSNYKRALKIAEQPLVVMDLIKKGQMTQQDVAHLKALYPDWYGRACQKVTEEMSNHVAKGKPVPYDIRLGLSTFLGQPMDSSLTPEVIQSNQSAFSAPQAQQPGPQSRKPSMAGMREMKGPNRLGLQRGDNE